MGDTIQSFYPWPLEGTTYSRRCQPTPPQKKFSKKERRDIFRSYAQAVADNLAGHPGKMGYVLDFDGGLYEISRAKRTARRLAENEAEDVRAHFKACAA